MKVNIGVSRRHVHLTKEDVKILFGDGYELTKFRDLSQPGQYACNEKVILKGERGSIPDVRVLGPERDKTQAEVTKTDCYRFGINAPVRNSGDLDDASKITIIGPKGEITKNAAIIAARHLHINPTDAKKLGIMYVKQQALNWSHSKYPTHGGITGSILKKHSPSAPTLTCV